MVRLRALPLVLLAACDALSPPVGVDSASPPSALDRRAGAPAGGALVAVPEGGFLALFPHAGTSAWLDGDGVRAGESLTLRLDAWGRTDALLPTTPVLPAFGACPEPDACAPVVEYARGPLTEWWTAHATGLEVGFDIASEPSGEGPLLLTLAVDGATVQGSEEDGLTLVETGGRRWELSPVIAMDAAGVALEAHLSSGATGLVITVDDSTAIYPIVIDPVLTTASSTINGASSGIEAGYSVAGAGDVNGDGYADIIVGAPLYGSSAGRAYVYHGSSRGISTTVATTLEAGTANGHFGVSVAGAGDVNHDGYGDVIVGEDGQNRAWVYFGSSRGIVTTGTSLAGDSGSSRFGHAVGGATDVNHDTYDDVLVGDGGFNGSKGKLYVFHGKSGGVNTTATTKIEGPSLDADLGDALSGAGDVNRDGYEDVVVGAPGQSSGAGAVYVYHGSSAGLATTATTTIGGRSGSGTGGAVSGGCDITGDGYADIVVGASLDTSGAGAAAIYLGSSSGVSSTSARGWNAPDGSGGFGGSVACLGDTDGDGYGDVVVSAPSYSTGRAYVFHGNSTGARTTAGETLSNSSGSHYGFSVGAAGDVNRDGVVDVVVGDYGTSSATGSVYVYHGDIDADGDGYGASTDCNDANAAINPAASETAGDGVDSNCDTDETCYVDADNDNYRTTTLSTVTSSDTDCSDSGEALATDPATDCNDAASTVHPSATESVGNGVDEDCDGLETCYVDGDGDSYRTSTTQTSRDLDCTDVGEAGPSVPSGDCNDSSVAIHPGATEVPADGVDQDCDSGDRCYQDADNDSYRPDTVSTVASADLDCADAYEATGSDPPTDCDDSRSSVHPGATETVADGVDQDCDTDETCYVDVDRDGYRPNGTTTVNSGDLDCVDAGEASSSTPSNDCDDANAAIHPGATETTGDGIDQDCNNAEDCYVDADNDGYRLTTTVASADGDCTDRGEATSSDPTGDCDDTVPTVHPGASEVTADAVDQDCNGGDICYVDVDADGYRPDASTTTASTDLDCVDAGEAATTVPAGDCDDASAAIHPGATEGVGDAVDQDCDNHEDCYVDNDGDTYRTDATVESTDPDCADRGEALASQTTGDCDDTSRTVYPGATEVVADGIDESCDNLELCYVDADGDAHRPDDTTTVASTDLACDGAGEADDSGAADDCNDADATIYGGAPEVAGDGIDQDCDGVESCFHDLDGDGYREDAATPGDDQDCDDPGEVPESTPAGDCDDANATVNPAMVEVPADHLDQDCDGTELCYADADDDGFRPDETSTVVSDDTDCDASGEANSSARTNDCDDTSAAVHPGAEELPGDNIDEDCDGEELCYTDGDTDGFRPDDPVPSTDTDCLDEGEVTADVTGGDCDDTNGSVFPGATEVCNGIDDNCDGSTDASDAMGQVTWQGDGDGDGYTDPQRTADGCAPPDGYGTPSSESDCDDGNADVNPGMTEVAGDGLDNDCDGSVDDATNDTGTKDPSKSCGCATEQQGGTSALLAALGGLTALASARRRRRA